MPLRNFEWNFYDTKVDAVASRRNLPHIDMPGVVTFVTFRLLDSMPQGVVKKWHDEIEAWLVQHSLAGQTVEQVFSNSSVDGQVKQELKRFKHRQWHGHLDDCHGECILRKPDVRKHVAAALLHFNNDKYELERFVIMPNHVHVLIQMNSGFLLRSQFREIQRYSARQINKCLNRSGRLWQGEPFDHVVRNECQFEYLQQYIDDNPRKARLKGSDYTLWVRPECDEK